MPDFGGRPEVIVPREQLPWLLDIPDDVLSTSAYHYNVLQGDYAFTSPKMLKDPYHEHVIHKCLPRNLSKIVPGIQEEVEYAMDLSWGMDTKSWKQLTVWDNMMFIMSHVTNRMFVGLPLCRNKHYLDNMSSFAMDVIATMMALGSVPAWLKPIAGPLVTMPNRRHWAATTKYTFPLIEERKAMMQKKEEDPSLKWEAPNDYLTWHITLATAEGRDDELATDVISRRLMPINFAAIHTTNLTATNVLFDLISSDPSKGFLEGIREEVTRVFKEEDGHWTKAGLQKLHRTDSAIRESMRLSNFMSRGVSRIVLANEGVTNKAEGWHAPKGTYIGTDVHNPMHDPELHPDPESYNAFRFSAPKEQDHAASGQITGGTGKTESLQLKNVDLINTSDTFLPFSHGRHACPGRFFVAMELKTILAHMVMNYDVEHLSARPGMKWLNAMRAPDLKGAIKVKRKEGTVKA